MEAATERQELESALAIAARLGIPVPEVYKAGVVDNLERLLDQARLVMDAMLPEPADPPGEFRP